MVDVVLPLKFLKNCKRSEILVELKNGDSAKGVLHLIDYFMNIKLKDVLYIEKEGPKFIKCNECFIRGSNVSSIQLRDDIVEKVKEVQLMEKEMVENKRKFLENKKEYNNKNESKGNNKNNSRGLNNSNITNNSNRDRPVREDKKRIYKGK